MTCLVFRQPRTQAPYSEERSGNSLGTRLLFRCRHAVVIMQILNLTNQYSLFMIVHHIFEISEVTNDDHPRTVNHSHVPTIIDEL